MADAVHDAGLAVGGAARTLVAGILPEPPAARRPGQRDLGRIVVVGDPQAAAREDRVRRDPGAEAEAGIGQRIAVGPGRMHVDDRQPARRLGHRLHEGLGLVEPHGVRRIVFIGLEVEGQEGPGARPRQRQEERRLLRARNLPGAEMIGAPQQSRRLGLGASRGAHRVGIVAAFARLVDDGEDVALAHQPEIGDGHDAADVDHRVQSQRRAIRRRRRDRILVGRQGRLAARCILPRSKRPGPRERSCEKSCRRQ